MNPFAPPGPPKAFHVMTKPTGAICNIGCKYCFYLEKEKLYPENRSFFMTDETLREYVKQYITAQEVDEIHFAWQGGEPTLLGVGFFEKAVAFQKEFTPPGKTVSNAFQTNGILLDDQWGSFLAREKFLVGISIDGPERIHNKYRVTKGGDPTFTKVMAGLQILKKHRVEFNTLTVVNRENSKHALEVYRFLRENGSGFMQFIPLVERTGDGNFLANPPLLPGGQVGEETRYPVTDWSVRPGDYGQFLCEIWDEWVRRDVGKTFVQLFDVQLGLWAGEPSSVCVFSETCGKALALEHNGDLYSCDHFVYPEYRLGNIFKESLGDMVQGPFQTRFGTDKRDTLPPMCRKCEFRFACHGECPKHRFLKTPEGDEGLNYLCSAYLKFFRHAGPHLNLMVDLLRQKRAPAEIMEILANQEARKTQNQNLSALGRNDPCPCGSGKKYKHCHGALSPQ